MGTVWISRLNVTPRHWREGFPGVTQRFEWFAIDYKGRFWIEKPGDYRFALQSDDGARLYIDDVLVIDDDCQHPPAVVGARALLAGGPHRIRVSYFQGPRDCLALVLAVAGPDEDWRVFDTEDFKPPTNPEDWKYGNGAELKPAPMQDRNRTSLKDVVGKPRNKVKDLPVSADWPDRTFHEMAAGCVAPPVRWCGR